MKPSDEFLRSPLPTGGKSIQEHITLMTRVLVELIHRVEQLEIARAAQEHADKLMRAAQEHADKLMRESGA